MPKTVPWKPVVNNAINSLPIISKKTEFLGEKGIYSILPERIDQGDNGESQVFRVDSESSDIELVAKIYNTISIADNKRMTDRHFVSDFLKNHTDYKSTHLLPLIDEGIINIDGISMPIEILPFCKAGHVSKLSYKELHDKLIPHIHKALHCMHSEKIIHRDIKPENIYIFDEEYVLGDFGISGKLSESGSNETTTRRSTPGYSANEVNNFVATIPSDYYAFGFTIATLFLGYHPYEEDIVQTVLLRKRKKIVFENIPEEYKSIETLINALTEYEAENRAGYEDVELWIKDEKEFCKDWKNKSAKFADDEYAFSFNGNMYSDKNELIYAFVDNWDIAKGDFFRGGLRFIKQLNYMDGTDDTFLPSAELILEEYETSKNFNVDVGFAKLLYYFSVNKDGNPPIFWCGHTFNSVSDIAKAVKNNPDTRNIVLGLLKNKFLSWRIKQISGCDASLLTFIDSTEKSAEDQPDFALYCFTYGFDNKEIEINPDEEFKKLLFSPNLYDSISSWLKNDELHARFYCKGYSGAVNTLRKSLSNDAYKNAVLLYKFFEAVCQNKTIVRRNFIHYGPLSFTVWIKNHLTDCYGFVTNNALKNAKDIINFDISEDSDVNTLLEKMTDLKVYCENLKGDLKKINPDFNTANSKSTNTSYSSYPSILTDLSYYRKCSLEAQERLKRYTPTNVIPLNQIAIHQIFNNDNYYSQYIAEIEKEYYRSIEPPKKELKISNSADKKNCAFSVEQGTFSYKFFGFDVPLGFGSYLNDLNNVIEKYNTALELMNNQSSIKNAADTFGTVLQFFDSKEKQYYCADLVNKRLRSKYYLSCKNKIDNISNTEDLNDAISLIEAAKETKLFSDDEYNELIEQSVLGSSLTLRDRIEELKSQEKYLDAYNDNETLIKFFNKYKKFNIAESVLTVCNEDHNYLYYQLSIIKMESAKDEKEYKDVAERFNSIKNYNDSDEKYAYCISKAEECRKAELNRLALEDLKASKEIHLFDWFKKRK